MPPRPAPRLCEKKTGFAAAAGTKEVAATTPNPAPAPATPPPVQSEQYHEPGGATSRPAHDGCASASQPSHTINVPAEAAVKESASSSGAAKRQWRQPRPSPGRSTRSDGGQCGHAVSSAPTAGSARGAAAPDCDASSAAAAARDRATKEAAARPYMTHSSFRRRSFENILIKPVRTILVRP